jgi:outer membrane protein
MILVLAAAAWLLILTPQLTAQDQDELALASRAASADTPHGSSTNHLKATLGAGVATAPEFEGSKKNEAVFVPVIELAYDRLFLSTSNGLGYRIIDTDLWTVAPSVRYRAGRDEDDSALLRGMGNLDPGLAAGAMVSYHPSDLSLFLNGYQGFGDVEGLTLEVGAAYSRQLMASLNASAQVSTMFSDQKYNQLFFGVSRQQAGRSGYRLYEPDSGFKHVALGGSVSYSLTQSVNVGVFGEYKLLTGPAADSPLVERGSKNQFTSGLMLGFNLK